LKSLKQAESWKNGDRRTILKWLAVESEHVEWI